MSKFCLSSPSRDQCYLKFIVFFIILLGFAQTPAAEKSDDKTVLLAILARNKEHVLPKYLECIENLDYNKQLISIYINTNNNEDQTKELLEDWVKKNEGRYKRIIFESHHVNQSDQTLPHQWTPERFNILAKIRNKSLQKAKEENVDFYFVVDCDNFVTPCALKELIKKDKPIIAPLLKAIPIQGFRYSNFFAAVTDAGYYIDHEDYDPIRTRQKVGTFKVPVVHCSYLIKSEFLDRLNYIDETTHYEFIVFSRTARENNIDQYICNEKNFGLLLHFGENLTLEEESQRVKEEPFQNALQELHVIYEGLPEPTEKTLSHTEQIALYRLMNGFIFHTISIPFLTASIP